jgi:hypothetical protein
MSILEDLKNTDDWSIRYGLWDKLFVGGYLFQELSQLDPSMIHDTVVTLEKMNAEAQAGDRRATWEWSTALGLLVCAQAAYSMERTPEHLLRLLRQVHPQAPVPVKLDSDWQEFVKSSFYQFAWPAPLSAEWAWDTFRAFGRSPRGVLQSVNITILLLQNNVGITANLALELMEEGCGTLYPNPESMSFVVRGDGFLQAEQNTVAFVRDQGLWPQNKDVRWMITQKNREPIFEIHGGSAGAAFALGLMKLLSSEP